VGQIIIPETINKGGNRGYTAGIDDPIELFPQPGIVPAGDSLVFPYLYSPLP
jgi:hypothetical protein